MSHDVFVWWIYLAIPRVIIEPPRPGKIPPGSNNRIPDTDQERTTTTARPPVTAKRISPNTTPSYKTPPPRKIIPTPKKPTIPTHNPHTPSPRTPTVVTHKTHVTHHHPTTTTTKAPAPTPRVPVVPPHRTPVPPVTPLDNNIHKDNNEKQRGDVHSKWSEVWQNLFFFITFGCLSFFSHSF